MPIPDITTLPAAPARSDDPDTFSTKADALVASLAEFVSDTNTLGLYLEDRALDAETSANDALTQAGVAAGHALTAQNASITASGAANYKGEYSAGTTYQIGHSTSYQNNLYIAKTVNTGVTPVDGANWFRTTTIYSNNVNYLSQSATLNILSTDAGSQVIVNPTADITLNLPAANALTRSTYYLFQNISADKLITVYNNAGTYITMIRPKETVYIWTSDISTAAGLWKTNQVDFVQKVSSLNVGSIDTITQESSDYSILGTDYASSLSSTKAVIATPMNGNQIRLKVVTQTAGVLSVGATTVFAPEYITGQGVYLKTHSATGGVLAYFAKLSATTIGLYLVAFTISADVITMGSPIRIFTSLTETIANQEVSFVKLIMTSVTGQYLIAWKRNSQALDVLPFSVSGTAITVGTSSTILTGTNPMHLTNTSTALTMAALSGTSVFICYNSTTSFITHGVLTLNNVGTGSASVSENSMTMSGTSGSGSSFYPGSVQDSVALSTTAAVVLWNDKFYSFTISGTVTTLGNSATVTGVGGGSVKITGVTATTALGVFKLGASGVGVVYTHAGTTVPATTSLGVSGSSYSSPSMCAFMTPAVASYTASNFYFGAPDEGVAFDSTKAEALVGKNIGVSGTTITPGTGFNVESFSLSNVYQNSAVHVGNNRFIVASLIGRHDSVCGVKLDLITTSNGVMTLAATTTLAITKPTIMSGDYLSPITLHALNDNIAILKTTGASSTFDVRVLDVTSGSFTVGTAVSLAAPFTTTSATAPSFILPLSSTKAVAIQSAGNTASYSRIINVSGTTITLGASTLTDNFGFTATTLSSFGFIASSATRYHMIFKNSTHNRLCARSFNVSGDTITGGSDSILYKGDFGSSDSIYINKISSTIYEIMMNNASTDSNIVRLDFTNDVVSFVSERRFDTRVAIGAKRFAYKSLTNTAVFTDGLKLSMFDYLNANELELYSNDFGASNQSLILPAKAVATDTWSDFVLVTFDNRSSLNKTINAQYFRTKGV